MKVSGDKGGPLATSPVLLGEVVSKMADNGYVLMHGLIWFEHTRTGLCVHTFEAKVPYCSQNIDVLNLKYLLQCFSH